MNVVKKDLEQSQVELNIELSVEEFQPYLDKAAEKISHEVEIKGFRPGKAPLEAIKQKVGEMTVLERAARLAINKTLNQAITENVKKDPIGQPRVDITKLSPGNPLSYKAVVSLLPEITLGDYKELAIEPEKIDFQGEEVDKTLKVLQEKQVSEEETKEPAETGDKVIADINISQDKVPVEGGQSQDTAVILGQDYFIPGFDTKLIKAKAGDELNFQLKYPDKHYQKNLAGKEADFNVKVKQVFKRNLPELNDAFAKNLGLNSLEELKGVLIANIKQEQQQKADQKTEIKLIDKILETSQFGQVPSILIEQEAEKILQDIEQNITGQGGTFEDYLQSIGKTKEQLLEELRPEAEKRVKTALLIREIAEQEKITASEEEIDKKQNELLEQYKGYEKVEARIKEPDYRYYLQNVLVNNKVLTKLKEWNLKTDSQAETEKVKDQAQAKTSQEEKQDQEEKKS